MYYGPLQEFGVDASIKEVYWLSSTSIEYNKKTSTQIQVQVIAMSPARKQGISTQQQYACKTKYVKHYV
jgi:hypothetical protein